MSTTRSYLRARFTEPAEFVAELRQDADLVERRIVRVTKAARPVHNGAVTRVTVIAGAIVDGRPVVLEHHIGELWGHAEDAGVQSTAQLVVEDLHTALTALGLDVRAGVLDTVQ